jgi:outer membrane protein assembly factor BamD
MKNRFIGLAIVILLSFTCGCAHHKAEEPKSPQVMFDKAKTLGTKGKTQLAIDAYMEVRTIYPSHDLAKKSLLEVADLYYKDKDFESAINNYNEFMQLYPTDPEVASCIYQTGMCHYRQMKTVDRDQAETINAINAFKELLARYPSSPYAGEARVKLADAETRLAKHYIYIGNFYLKNKDYAAACDRFKEVKNLFPEIAAKENIDDLISKACK